MQTGAHGVGRAAGESGSADRRRGARGVVLGEALAARGTTVRGSGSKHAPSLPERGWWFLAAAAGARGKRRLCRGARRAGVTRRKAAACREHRLAAAARPRRAARRAAAAWGRRVPAAVPARRATRRSGRAAPILSGKLFRPPLTCCRRNRGPPRTRHGASRWSSCRDTLAILSTKLQLMCAPALGEKRRKPSQPTHARAPPAPPQLGVCVTVLKQRCREFGVTRWPYRKVRFWAPPAKRRSHCWRRKIRQALASARHADAAGEPATHRNAPHRAGAQAGRHHQRAGGRRARRRGGSGACWSCRCRRPTASGQRGRGAYRPRPRTRMGGIAPARVFLPQMRAS